MLPHRDIATRHNNSRESPGKEATTMKLALYLPNFRDKVTVGELSELTDLAEELDFDSVWTLDRIIVPEASDRGELQYAFGMMDGFPKQLPVTAHGEFLQGMPLIPWLAAKTSKVRIGMSIIDTPFRAPGVLAAELATIDHLSDGRLNVAVGSGWMPEEFAAASASAIFPRRHAHVRETIEIMQGIWTNDLFEYHGEFADFEKSGFGAKPLQKPFPPMYFSGLKDARRSALRVAKYGMSGWIGIQDSPAELSKWRTAIAKELDDMDTDRTIDDVQMCSMIWFVITDEKTDQSDNGKLTNLLAGTAEQITDILKRYAEAGLDMPLLWPPFTDVPVSKTLDDLKRLTEEIMPKVDAG
ncbi:F420-dependent glucose-6-phosphate dehydrogenase [Gordonia bronchialis]|nr:F420-dependent glucose-6-phosphate dehydrogenase [Gordonia bronchialis]